MNTPHTLQSLLTLAETEEGRQKIRVMVAEAAGKQVIYFGYDYEYMGKICHAGSWATKETAERVRNGQKNLRWKTAEIREIQRTDHLPRYHDSLDAIMPEVRKLSVHARNDYNQHLWLVCGNDAGNFIAWGEWFQRALYSVIQAEPIHHCIALLLTIQPTTL